MTAERLTRVDFIMDARVKPAHDVWVSGVEIRFTHGATPCLPSATANFTASMIFT